MNTKKSLNFFKQILCLFVIWGFVYSNIANSQCKPMIKIEGKATVVDFNDPFGLTLPYWLSENRSLAVGSSVNSISIIEFDVNGNTLEFSQVIYFNSTTPVNVPPGKVWKIESIAKANNSSTYNKATFGVSGSYTWKVPACAEEICIEAWGAGGGGGGGAYSSAYRTGGGGGGGGFASKCFSVTPGTDYSINVGKGGAGGTGNWSAAASAGSNGGNSEVSGTGVSIIAYGGSGGGGGQSGTANGGAGGDGSVASSAKGANGENGISFGTGRGGAGANGGAGGEAIFTYGYGNPGLKPGGGGSGGIPSGSSSSSWNAGGAGADGKVIISW